MIYVWFVCNFYLPILTTKYCTENPWCVIAGSSGGVHSAHPPWRNFAPPLRFCSRSGLEMCISDLSSSYFFFKILFLNFFAKDNQEISENVSGGCTNFDILILSTMASSNIDNGSIAYGETIRSITANRGFWIFFSFYSCTNIDCL